MRIFLLILVSLFLCSCASKSRYPDASEIVFQNQGNTLSPSDTATISWDSVKEGFEFEIAANVVGKEATYLTKYKLVSVEGDEYIFDLYSDGELVAEAGFMYKNGREHKKYRDGKYRHLDAFDGCQWVVGECQFEGSRGKEVTMYTTFNNGVWVNKYSNPSLSNRDATITTVYDKLGLLLYKHTKVESLSLPINSLILRVK